MLFASDKCNQLVHPRLITESRQRHCVRLHDGRTFGPQKFTKSAAVVFQNNLRKNNKRTRMQLRRLHQIEFVSHRKCHILKNRLLLSQHGPVIDFIVHPCAQLDHLSLGRCVFCVVLPVKLQPLSPLSQSASRIKSAGGECFYCAQRKI